MPKNHFFEPLFSRNGNFVNSIPYDDKKKYYRKKLIMSADNDDFQLKRSGP